jgi:general secretion pathway protein K
LALVAVLWAIVLLTVMAASFSLSMQRDAGLVRNAQERARGLALADAGVHYAMLMLSLPDPLKRWRGDGTPYQVRLPGGAVAVSIFDESGKIDLNAAQEPTLRALLGRALNDPERGDALADAILDWRDADDLKRLHGAEAKEYQAENKAYAPPNKNFQALEELQMVLGVTPALYTRLEPLLTIYTGQDGLNPQKASREVLLTLPGMDDKTVADYLAQRAAAPNNALPPLALTPGGIRALGGGDIAYTVIVEAHPEAGQSARADAVIRRQPAHGAPFAVVAWKTWRRRADAPTADGEPPFSR